MIGYRLIWFAVLAASPLATIPVDSPPDSPGGSSSGTDPGEGTGPDFLEPGLIYTPPAGNAVDFVES